jgi:hypothetical protein
MNLKTQQLEAQVEGSHVNAHETFELTLVELEIVGGGAGVLNYD